VATRRASPSKKAAPKKPAAAEAPDARFDPVMAALAKRPGVTVMGSKSGALRSLMRAGKAFAMSSHGRFVLKLNEERAAALIEKGVGEPFEHAPGRPMKGWIQVTSPSADWVALAEEALGLASGGLPAKKTKRA
jgi:hypothetical protein